MKVRCSKVTEEGRELSLGVTGAFPHSDYHHKAGRCWGCEHPGRAPSGPRDRWSPGHSLSTAAPRGCRPAAPAGPPRTYRWTSACSSDACGSAGRRSSRNTTWENVIKYHAIIFCTSFKIILISRTFQLPSSLLLEWVKVMTYLQLPQMRMSGAEYDFKAPISISSSITMSESALQIESVFIFQNH